MICTDTDNYVNINYKERNKKPCSFKVAYLFYRTSCSKFFFEKYCVKCTKALAAIPSFHCFTGQQGKGGGFLFRSSLPLLHALETL